VVTTTVAGSLYVTDPTEDWLGNVLRGWVFSVPLMAILLVHEMGHYLAARRRRLDVSPPYFIPAIPPVGTFGAFIKIRSAIPSKKVLIEVGSWGPLAGSMVAVPVLILGSCLSEIRSVPSTTDGISIHFGTSLILEALFFLRFGEFSSSTSIYLHPTAMAAWYGLFITALNLLPMGQLDGGHVIYALFGPRKAQVISFAVFVGLIPLGALLWPGWLLFGILALFIGLRHPEPVDPYTPLDRSGRILGWTAIVLFVLTFIPAPISVVH
jgi:membrane-associated protease RseP (regulator of RpoE activity)